MPNDDEWEAFADSDEEEEPAKKEATKPVAAKGNDSSGGDDWEDSDEDKTQKKPAADPKPQDDDNGGWEDDSDDEDDAKKKKDAEAALKAQADRNKDTAEKPVDNWEDESGEDTPDEDDTREKGPKERENKDHVPLYGKRLKEHKAKQREERLKLKAAQKAERAKALANMTAEEKAADLLKKNRYTEDNALLFGDTQIQSGWQDLELTFTARPLGFSVDSHKRVRKLNDSLGESGLTRGAIIIKIEKSDVTKHTKDQVLQRLKTIAFPMKLTFYNPPYDDALLKTEEANRLHKKPPPKKAPVGKISLSDYPLGCPGDFKKFGSLVGKMVQRSRFNNKGECVIPFLKEVLFLSMRSLEVDEIGQVQSNINQIWQSANRKRRGGKKKSKFTIKQECEANYQDTGEWYKVLILEVLKGQKYRVKYPEYDNELEVVPESRLREPKKKITKHKYKFEEDDFDFLDDADSD